MINRFKKYYNVDNTEITPPPESNCYPFDLITLTSSSVAFQFDTCSGEKTSIVVPGNQVVKICASNVYRPAVDDPTWTIATGDKLCDVEDNVD